MSIKLGRRIKIAGIFCCLLSPFFSAQAQFYTGSEMTFGRKRVQYESFFWSYYRFHGFDVYFNRKGKNLALYTANYVQHHLPALEEKIGFKSMEGMKFIVYNRLSDFKQSNIGYIDEATETGNNTGGVTRFIDNKVFLYFNGDYVDFEAQIRLSIAELLVTQAIKGVKTGTQYKNSYLMDLPYWFTTGLASYMANPWTEALDERIQYSIEKKNFRHIDNLEGEEAAFAGHSFWHFIGEVYGEDAVRRCIRVVATERQIEKTFKIALNRKFKEVVQEWRTYYQELDDEFERDSLTFDELLKRTNRPDRRYQQLVVNPQNNQLAFVTNHLGRAKVWIQTSPTQRRCVYRTGAAINDKPDYTFPVLAWHPNGKILGIMGETQGRTSLLMYDLEKNKKWHQHYYLDIYEKVHSFSFSENGRSIALSASSNGQSDIYIFHLGAGTSRQITFDLYDDKYPVFLPDSPYLIFTSNRPDTEIRKGEKFEIAPSLTNTHNLFAYDLEGDGRHLIRLSRVDSNTTLTHPQLAEEKTLMFLNNANGIRNLSIGTMGKEISHIDTAIHYKSTFDSKVISDYDAGVQFLSTSPQQHRLSQIVVHKGRYYLGSRNMDSIPRDSRTNQPTRFREKSLKRKVQEERRRKYQDSLQKAMEKDTTLLLQQLALEESRSKALKLRYSTWADRKETTAYDRRFASDILQTALGDTLENTLEDSVALPLADSTRKEWTSPGDSSLQAEESREKIPPLQHTYKPEFVINESTAQLGFSFLNAMYQNFSGFGSPIYLNPSMNALTKISLSDLMENHRLIGGFSLSFDLSSLEFLLSYEYLEKRLGHQVVGHMQSLNQQSYYPAYHENTFDLHYILKYPLTPVSMLRGSVFGRYDRTILKATEYNTLIEPDQNMIRVGLKGEWVYDHSRSVTRNILYGTRGKVWVEYYQGVWNDKNNMFVVGVDFRDYRRLYKTMIWANRVAFSTSFGQSKLLYYMGGVDNWILPSFNQNVNLAQDHHYAYQTLATNMRGFIQNIRNGNSFFVINSEIRCPIVQIFSSTPVKSSFLRHLQLVVFGDIGSAWLDWNPWSKKNLFYQHQIQNGSNISINLEKDANPIVGGFGAGLRCQLLGYFIRLDAAWGVENNVLRKKPVFYLSFSTDF